MSKKVRIHQIQALRALASLLVVLFHAKLSPGGFIGVDIFYVISGYLITGLIIKEIDLTQNFAFARFYLRRAKRLLPASISILLATAILSWVFLPATIRANLGKDILAATIYISNYLFAFWENDYQNLNATPSPVIHYWSLAVEEQFYLFWPLIIFALWKFGGKRSVFLGIFFITTLSFIFSIYLTQNAPIWAFYSLPTRAWELGIGALILFIPPSLIRKRSLLTTIFIWFGVSLMALGLFAFNESTPFPGYNALLPTLATSLLIAFVASWPPILNDISKLKVVQWLGEISYPFYLWHWPILVIPSSRFGRELALWERLLLIALTALLADITHRFLEKPIAVREISGSRISRYSLAATCAGIITAGGILATSQGDITLPNGSSVSIAAVMTKPVIYDDECHANYGDSKLSECLYGDKGSDRNIVLYGDSHAAQWFPALNEIAKNQGFALTSLTKSACPATQVLRIESGAFKNADCVSWRKTAIARIRELKPEAVLISGFQHFNYPKSETSRDAWWFAGQRAAFQDLLGSSPKLIYISDTPHPLRDIPSCLASGAGEACDTAKKSDPRIAGGFIKLDPTDWLCQENCPAIVNGIVAYRDASHLSVEMSRALAPKLSEFLRGQNVL